MSNSDVQDHIDFDNDLSDSDSDADIDADIDADRDSASSTDSATDVDSSADSASDSERKSIVDKVECSPRKPARCISSTPIPVHATATLFDTPAPEELIDDKPFIVRCLRKFVTSSVGMWMRIAGKVSRKFGFYPSVEPYIGYGTDSYARLICRTVYAPSKGHHSVLKRGIYAMLVVPAVRVRVSISIDDVPVERAQVGDSEVYDKIDARGACGAEYCISDRAGYLDLITERALCVGRHTVTYSVDGREPVESSLFAISPSASIGIISDVDDTIMITQAPSPIKAAYNVLIMNPEHRSPVRGMSSLFSKISKLLPDAPFFYLSTSPWNVEASIRHFIVREGFPEGPLLLRDLDPRPKTFIPTGPQHKMEFAAQLMDDFPHMRFILLGDDGQKDPSTYAKIIEQYPGRVAAVGIRQLKHNATVKDFRRRCARDFNLSFSTSRLAYSDIDKTSDAVGAAGTVNGVPFFVSPEGESLSDMLLPYITNLSNNL